MKDESEAVVMLKPYLNKATVQVFINEQSLAAAGVPLWSESLSSPSVFVCDADCLQVE